MGIIRSDSGKRNSRAGVKAVDKGDGLTVTCPKCRASIVFSGLHGDTPIRCGSCNYPLIRRSDMFSIIAACKTVKTASQASCAVSVLRRLAEFMPEAGTALGLLPSQLTIPLPLSESERWNVLANAYAAGDDNAREGLNLMRQSSPDLYSISYCKSCGAMKYHERHASSTTACPYCQRTD